MPDLAQHINDVKGSAGLFSGRREHGFVEEDTGNCGKMPLGNN